MKPSSYVNEVLRPDINDTVSGKILGFETFLHERRQTRMYRLAPFLALGKEDVPVFLVTGLYLLVDWYLRFHVSDHAGPAHELFDILLYVGSGLTVVSLWMAIAVGKEYATLGKAGLEEKGNGSTPLGADPPEDGE